MPIKILSENLINKIAAGEVVERPSSALKELCENAIDAKAMRIDVTIHDGGKSLIEIIDDGKGISKEELPLAITRHATSKLDTEDLTNINFLGFRGEALPSIGSVSRLTITSRTKESDSAWQMKVIGGNVFETEPKSRSIGTTVSVSDLFFSTPARLKFLKTSATEAAYCEEVVQKLAMANPEISFSFATENRKIFKYSSSSLEKRLEDAIGKDFMDNAVKVCAETEDVSLNGYVGIPTFNKANSKYQFFFVNGRAVKDKFLANAVKSAFYSLISPDRFPVAALFLNINPEMVDVNVHPQKSEVRFKDSGVIRGVIISAIKNALNSGASNQTVSLEAMLNHELSSNKTPASNSYSFLEKKEDFKLHEARDTSFIGNEHSQINIPEVKYDFPLGLAKLQVKNTYIISETEEGIVITDQHASHERLTYERLAKGYLSGKVATQMLLIPEIVELKSDEYDALLRFKDAVSRLGLIYENFGGKAIIVRETPAILGNFDIKQMMIDLAITILDYKGEDFLKDKLKDVVATMSCHGSIRAGRTMNINEMNELLRQIESEPNAGQCIHGRPTYIKMSLNTIEKLFLRK